MELKKGYVEPLNLYTIITAEPSELKSPTLKRFKLPLEQWEKAQHAREKESISAITSENKTLEKLIESKRAKVVKTKKNIILGYYMKNIIHHIILNPKGGISPAILYVRYSSLTS